MDDKTDRQIIEELTDNVKTLHEENAKQKELIEKYQFERQSYISVDNEKDNMIVFGRFEAIFRLKQILEENKSLNECNKHESFVGVGDGTGNKFVYGTHESIKKVQEFIFENERLKKENEELNFKLKSIQALFL